MPDFKGIRILIFEVSGFYFNPHTLMKVPALGSKDGWQKACSDRVRKRHAR